MTSNNLTNMNKIKHVAVIDRNPNRDEFVRKVIDIFRQFKRIGHHVSLYVGTTPDVISSDHTPSEITRYYWDYSIVKRYMDFISEHSDDEHIIIFKDDSNYLLSANKHQDIDENFAINNNMKIMYLDRVDRTNAGVRVVPIIDIGRFVIEHSHNINHEQKNTIN